MSYISTIEKKSPSEGRQTGTLPRWAQIVGNTIEVERPKLSNKECQVLLFIADGYTTGDIAEILGLSKMTIDTHRRSIMRKLCVSNMMEAVAYGFRNQLIA
jgi:DNA-binding NarL/FixJ family response regulator